MKATKSVDGVMRLDVPLKARVSAFNIIDILTFRLVDNQEKVTKAWVIEQIKDWIIYEGLENASYKAEDYEEFKEAATTVTKKYFPELF